jgi:hypothetical protein
MKQIIRSLPAEAFFLLVIILAGILRFCCYSSFSFSNDELSALFRADQPGFSAMIHQGVIPDFHPAGAEVLIFYWTRWFGTTEASVRLPFVIFGILSLFPAYFIGKRWFGKTSGLFFIASLAFLQFPILFSQIARPYASGMFFSLSMILFWSRLVFPQHKDIEHRFLNIAGYGLTTAACAYDHYFCGLVAIMVGVTGMILVQKKGRRPFYTGLLISILLFLPHIKISLLHFSKGGIGEWLGKPGPDWIPQHFFYLFNESWLFLSMAFIVCIISLYLNRNNLTFNKFHIILLSWVLIPLFVGYFYSLYINPVIQDSVLLFSSPLLFLFLASWWQDLWSGRIIIILLAYIFWGLIDTVVINKYYQQQHFGEFRDIAVKINEWNTKLGSDKITQVISVNNPYYIDFYFNRLNKSYSFAQYDNRGGKDLFDLVQVVEKSKTPYFVAAWTKPAPDEIDGIIRNQYPCILERKDYGGLSGITLYTRKTNSGIPCVEDTALSSIVNDFEGNKPWPGEENYNKKIEALSGKNSVLLTHNTEYGPTYQSVLQDIKAWPFRLIRISLDAKILEAGSDAQLVADLFTPEGKSYAWASMNFNNYLSLNKQGKVFFTYYIPKEAKPSDVLKVYCWNHGMKNVVIDNFTIGFFNQ